VETQQILVSLDEVGPYSWNTIYWIIMPVWQIWIQWIWSTKSDRMDSEFIWLCYIRISTEELMLW